MEDSYTHISPEEFAELNFEDYTLVDLREPDELIVSKIGGAVNIPFSGGFGKLDTIPGNKPVIVFCRVGDWSEQVAEILADRGYTVSTLDGGYQAYRALTLKKDTGKPEKADPKREKAYIDAKGLKCPGPIVKVADFLRDKPAGTEVRVEATEDAFASDIKVWCERTGNRLDRLAVENGIITAEITRSEKEPSSLPSAQEEQNGKTFVVFSGDLDKTIAAFIMANGAAAMGRRVTIFFTFWGLNILRRPEKVKVGKTPIEKMFGFMMPRGTKKLGLSRMNMGGAGAGMIRAIMKNKGVSSLEELIADAIAHGVRLVACQMSMDIMGIHKEELIDGVELGGVSTFLGSGEQSDMSLFI
ncbi:MAG: DsrE/DsrF/DrsH-like family protein [Clostridia bacterium]|nr:DsrE/DsrF/DrsH-like family protein [Clostridia bacterium]